MVGPVENLKEYSLPDWESVQLNQDGSNMFSGSGDETGDGILDTVQFSQVTGRESRKCTIAEVQPSRDKGLEQGFGSWQGQGFADATNLTKVEKLRFTNGRDMGANSPLVV